MKRLLKLLLGVVVALAALMLVVGLAIRMMLSGSAKDSVVGLIESRLKAPVAIESGDFDLAQWFRFTPAITLRGFSIGNPEGFSAGKMIEAEEVSVQVALLSLLSDRIEVRGIVLRRPQFNLETNAEGRSNLSALFPATPGEGEAPAGENATPTALAIAALTLEDGTLRYLEQGGGEPLTVDHIGLHLTDFAPDTGCRFELTGQLFGGANCRVRFAGNAGPFRRLFRAGQRRHRYRARPGPDSGRDPAEVFWQRPGRSGRRQPHHAEGQGRRRSFRGAERHWRVGLRRSSDRPGR
jgi:uncharacterized protein YhdP